MPDVLLYRPKEVTMVRTRSPIVPVLNSLAEANAVLKDIGQHARLIDATERELEAKIALLRDQANKEIAPLEAQLKQKTKQLELFAESNRETLVDGDKKSVVLPAGEFGWRITPPKVTFGKGGAKKVLALLQSLKLKDYIRTISEVDREALLRDRPQVKGVKYTQDELFYIKPHTEKEPDLYPGAVAKINE